MKGRPTESWLNIINDDEFLLFLLTSILGDSATSGIDNKVFLVRSIGSAFFSLIANAVEVGVLSAVSKIFGKDKEDTSSSLEQMSSKQKEKMLRNMNNLWKRLKLEFI